MAKNKIPKMDFSDWLAIGLLIIGGLNWGLFGLIRFDLVSFLFGQFSFLSRIIYSLVGLSAIYSIFRFLDLSR